MLQFSERAIIAIERAQPSEKGALNHALKSLETGHPKNPTAVRIRGEHRIFAIRVTDDIRLLYSDSSGKVIVHDIINRSEYAP